MPYKNQGMTAHYTQGGEGAALQADKAMGRGIMAPGTKWFERCCSRPSKAGGLDDAEQEEDHEGVAVRIFDELYDERIHQELIVHLKPYQFTDPKHLDLMAKLSCYPVVILQRHMRKLNKACGGEDIPSTWKDPSDEELNSNPLGVRRIDDKIHDLDSQENLKFELRKLKTTKSFQPSRTAVILSGGHTDRKLIINGLEEHLKSARPYSDHKPSPDRWIERTCFQILAFVFAKYSTKNVKTTSPNNPFIKYLTTCCAVAQYPCGDSQPLTEGGILKQIKRSGQKFGKDGLILHTNQPVVISSTYEDMQKLGDVIAADIFNPNSSTKHDIPPSLPSPSPVVVSMSLEDILRSLFDRTAIRK